MQVRYLQSMQQLADQNAALAGGQPNDNGDSSGRNEGHSHGSHNSTITHAACTTPRHSSTNGNNANGFQTPHANRDGSSALGMQSTQQDGPSAPGSVDRDGDGLCMGGAASVHASMSSMSGVSGMCGGGSTIMSGGGGERWPARVASLLRSVGEAESALAAEEERSACLAGQVRGRSGDLNYKACAVHC